MTLYPTRASGLSVNKSQLFLELELIFHREKYYAMLNFSTDFYKKYKDYFTIPYFIFVRDTLSYLALLGLHFAICLESSQVAFSGLEWAILLFLVGRILTEIKQIVDLVRSREKNMKLKALNNYFRYRALLSFVNCDIFLAYS